MTNRQVIITSGCDWVDAGFQPIEIPEEMVMETAKKEYNDWRAMSYCLGSTEYVSFAEFLVKFKGAKILDIEVFQDD